MKQQILWVVEASASGIEVRRFCNTRSHARAEASRLRDTYGWESRIVKYIREA